MTTPADYDGRRVDVLAFQAGTPLVQELAAPGEGGRVCAGVVKLAQRWVLTFLQEAGSVPYRPAAGTGFVTALRTGGLRTESDVRRAFAVAERLVRRQLAAAEAAADPADERIDRADLDGVSVAPGAGLVTVRATVVSAAGAARAVVLPLPLTP